MNIKSVLYNSHNLHHHLCFFFLLSSFYSLKSKVRHWLNSYVNYNSTILFVLLCTFIFCFLKIKLILKNDLDIEKLLSFEYKTKLSVICERTGPLSDIDWSLPFLFQEIRDMRIVLSYTVQNYIEKWYLDT